MVENEYLCKCSNKCKDMPFSNPLNQYKDICREAMKACKGKMNKAFKEGLVEILLLYMLLPRKINYTQLSKYGQRCEKSYRHNFTKSFDWLGFNKGLATMLFENSKRRVIAIDPSYISKSGKHTQGIGRFWSGCADAVKHGLEILGIGLVDVDMKEYLTLRSIQTPPAEDLKGGNLTLTSWYLHNILNMRDHLIELSQYVVADAYFSTHPFVQGLHAAGFHLISRFKRNAVLMYLHSGPATGKKGRPKIYDGRINFADLDFSKMEKVDIFPQEGEYHTLIAYSKALKRKVRLVIFKPNVGAIKLYFSTDISMEALDVVDYYRSRFQIEFSFRDAKQFTGLCNCQARSLQPLDFAFNASFSAVNVAKILIHTHYNNLSIGGLKSLLYNLYISHRIFGVCGLRPNLTKNIQIFKDLFTIAAPAA